MELTGAGRKTDKRTEHRERGGGAAVWSVEVGGGEALASCGEHNESVYVLHFELACLLKRGNVPMSSR